MLKWSLPQSVSAAIGLIMKPNRVNAHIHAQETYRKYVEVQITYLHGNISNIRILSSSYMERLQGCSLASCNLIFDIWFHVVILSTNPAGSL